MSPLSPPAVLSSIEGCSPTIASTFERLLPDGSGCAGAVGPQGACLPLRSADSARRFDGPQPARKLDTSEVTPGDLRMLRNLAREARLAAITAMPATTAAGRLRKRPWIRKAFLNDSIQLLGLLDTLARQVEDKIWGDR